jgi:hypothetical protein
MPVLKIANKLSSERNVRIPESFDPAKGEESHSLHLALDLKDTVRDNLRYKFRAEAAQPASPQVASDEERQLRQMEEQLRQQMGGMGFVKIVKRSRNPDGTFQPVEPKTVDQRVNEELPAAIRATFMQLTDEKYRDRLTRFQQLVLVEFRAFAPDPEIDIRPLPPHPV